MDKCIDNIIKHKKELSINSIKTYSSILKSIFKKMTGKSVSDFDIKEFKNSKDVLSVLKDDSDKNKKVKLSAVIVGLESNPFDGSDKAIKEYRDIIMKINEDLKKTELNQEQTDKQKEAFIEWNNVINIHNGMKKKFKNLSDFSKKELLPYIVLSLYTMIPPRRLIDYTLMKFKDYDEDKDNYFVPRKGNKKGYFIFNVYKTAKQYGKQKVELPNNDLNKLLVEWEPIADSDFILGEQMTNVKLNGILNKIFDKKVGASTLRSSYLTNLYKDIPKLKDMVETANDMAHSVNIALTEYVKK